MLRLIRKLISLIIILFSISAPAKVLPPRTPTPAWETQGPEVPQSERVHGIGGGYFVPWDALKKNPKLTCTEFDPAYCDEV